MLDTFHIGMSGLIAYSKGLQVVGNNLTNVNTPGFKASDMGFSGLFTEQNTGGGAGGTSNSEAGSGLGTLATRVDFQQGTLNQTGNPLDLAVNGQGFFITRDGAKMSYTRAGQFQFDKDGFLTSSSNGKRVAGMGDSGQLQDISLASLKTNPAKQTTRVTLQGILSSNATADIVTGGINVIDPAGGQHVLSLTLHNNSATTAGNWTATVKNEAGATVGTGSLQFSNGIPDGTANTFTFTYAPPNLTAFPVTLDFSKNVNSADIGATSTLSVASADGNATGTLTGESFDSSGTLVATYSNGQTANGPRLALAIFDSNTALVEESGNQFRNTNARGVHFGSAGIGAFGVIASGVIEGSNVDLSQQFSNLIVMQRGYQAASQVLSTANDLVQNLLDMKRQ